MKDALSSESLIVIDNFVMTEPLLVFDIDGTLAPLAPRPDQALIPAEIQRLLNSLVAVTRVAIVTGRSVADARRMISFCPLHVIGNHGAEGVPGFEARQEQYRQICGGWIQQLADAAYTWQGIDGVILENKDYSLAFHYRLARNRNESRQSLEQVALRLRPTPHLVPGKHVINVLPAGAPHKGDAIRELISKQHRGGVLYMGDDTTDEDVFALDLPQLLTIRVGRDSRSAAQMYLQSQAHVLELLRKLLQMVETARAELNSNS